MKKKLAAVGSAVLVFVTLSLYGRETQVQIGRFQDHRGAGITFLVHHNTESVDPNGRALLHIYDEHVVNSLMLSLSVQDLERLKGLIDETIAEMQSR